MQENKIWKICLSVLLILQIIVALWLAIFTIVDFAGILGQFGLKFQPEMSIIQLIMLYGWCLSFCFSLWGVIWIGKGDIAGIQAGVTLGLILFLVGIVVFIRFGRVDILLFDSVRGLFMVGSGILAFKEGYEHNKTML
jgi:hypothetical protein